MSGFLAPHQGIAAASLMGSPLLLRLRSGKHGRHGHWWVRVHENGDLERSDGDERSDVVVRALAAVGRDDRRVVEAARTRDLLFRRLWPRDLSAPAPWGKYYPVQAFAGADKVIEGYIGVEVDMGMRSDIFGLDGDDASAAALLDGIVELLGFLAP